MKQIATIPFQDANSADDAVAIIRSDAHAVGLSLSLRADGDLEVFMAPHSAELLIAALQEAVAYARGSSAESDVAT